MRSNKSLTNLKQILVCEFSRKAPKIGCIFKKIVIFYHKAKVSLAPQWRQPHWTKMKQWLDIQ